MSAPGAPSNAHSAMDQMYRYTRHIYDFTRKYYLFGRDKLIEELPVTDGDHICEVGCGTARNLVLLARKRPGLHLYGIDASAEMLKTAQTSVDGAGLTSNAPRAVRGRVWARRVCHSTARRRWPSRGVRPR